MLGDLVILGSIVRAVVSVGPLGAGGSSCVIAAGCDDCIGTTPGCAAGISDGCRVVVNSWIVISAGVCSSCDISFVNTRIICVSICVSICICVSIRIIIIYIGAGTCSACGSVGCGGRCWTGGCTIFSGIGCDG